METGLNAFNGFMGVVRVLLHPGLSILAFAAVLCFCLNWLKDEMPVYRRGLKVVQLFIVIGAIGAIGTIGWKVYSVNAPSPQEPVKKRLVLLEGEGEWR